MEKLVPARLNPPQADTISAALRLSGQPVSRDLQARLAQAGTDSTLAAQFAGLPNRLTDLRIATPTHLDILKIAGDQPSGLWANWQSSRTGTTEISWSKWSMPPRRLGR
ncbi:hypothetical protein [Reyranella sp.]|uniref:hypothetical protein n=1 Tax=Reyranella sp. TaxID=1929291 RepID=UPI003D124512